MKFYLSYYGLTVLFSLISGSIALCMGFKHRNKFAALNIFYLYPLASLLQSATSLISYATHNLFNIKDYSITNAAANIFMLAEFLLIYNFFYRVLLSKSIKQIMRVISLVYIIIIIANWIFFKGLFNWSNTNILVAQAIVILLPALYYFFELFKNPEVTDLPKSYTFWLSLGVIIYFACTLPIFLFKDFAYNKKGLLKEANLYSINSIFYGIFFLLITKAYLCPKKDAQQAPLQKIIIS